MSRPDPIFLATAAEIVLRAGDIQMATDIATKMVTTWGMSDRFGMVAYGRGAAPAAATAARSPQGEASGGHQEELLHS